MLMDNYLYAVVSLPAGVFNPYSGVKTSILLMDKEISKKRNEILFVKIDNDGFNLGAQRNAVKGGQLEEAIKITHDFIATGKFEETTIAHLVPKIEVAKNGEYNFSGDGYKVKELFNSKFDFFPLEKVSEISSGNSAPQDEKLFENGIYPFCRTSDVGQVHLSSDFRDINNHLNETGIKGLRLFKKGTILFPKSGASTFLNHRVRLGIDSFVSSHLATIYANDEKINSLFLYHLLCSVDAKKLTNDQNYPSLKLSEIGQIQIPLPPLSMQEKIVIELEEYQKIINGAKAVVDNYKPKIDVDPDWELVELDSISEVISGNAFSSSDFKDDNPIRCIKITNVGVREFVDDDTSRLPESYINEYSRFAVNTGDLVISLTRTIISSGLKVAIVPESWNNTLVNQRVAAIKPTMNANINFIYHYLCSDTVYKYVEEQSRSLMQPNLSITDLKKLNIPNPPIEIQNKIVAQIENEEKLVNASKELIEIFENKIKEKIAKVWRE